MLFAVVFFSLSLSYSSECTFNKNGKRDEMRRCMPISYAVLLFDSNGSFLIIQHQLAHRTYRHIGTHTVYNIVLDYHLPFTISHCQFCTQKKNFYFAFYKTRNNFRYTSILPGIDFHIGHSFQFGCCCYPIWSEDGKKPNDVEENPVHVHRSKKCTIVYYLLFCPTIEPKESQFMVMWSRKSQDFSAIKVKFL